MKAASAKTDIAGYGGKCRKKGNRFELRDIADGGTAQRFDVRAAGTDTIRHEDEIEFCSFGSLRKRDIMGEVGAGIGLCIGMAPGGNMGGRSERERLQA